MNYDFLKQHSAGLRNNRNGEAKENNNNNKEEGEDQVRYVISKLPNHFELLGLIHKLFPGAPILHTTRDVRDTLLSNYQMAYQQVDDKRVYVGNLCVRAHMLNFILEYVPTKTPQCFSFFLLFFIIVTY
jgi:hypothetical protein